MRLSWVLTVEMDVEYSPYYKVNKYLLSTIGQWPYQKKIQKFLITSFLYVALISLLVPEVIFYFMENYNWIIFIIWYTKTIFKICLNLQFAETDFYRYIHVFLKKVFVMHFGNTSNIGLIRLILSYSKYISEI